MRMTSCAGFLPRNGAILVKGTVVARPKTGLSCLPVTNRSIGTMFSDSVHRRSKSNIYIGEACATVGIRKHESCTMEAVQR